MTRATTLDRNGRRVGTGYGEPWSAADIAAVREGRRRGFSRKQIAALLGVKYARVAYLCQRLGIA